MTRKKTQCVIEDARLDPKNGKWLCHVHHSGRTFQQQMAARPPRLSRAERTAKRLTPLNVKRPKPVVVETPALKDRA